MRERSVLIIIDFNCSMGRSTNWNDVLFQLEIDSSRISNLNSAFDSLCTNLKCIINSNQSNTIVLSFKLYFVLLFKECMVDNISCVIGNVIESRTIKKRHSEFVVGMIVNERILGTTFNVLSHCKKNLIID